MAIGSSTKGESAQKAFEKKGEHLLVTAKASTDNLKLFIDCKRLVPKSDHRYAPEDLLPLLEGIDPELILSDSVKSVITDLNLGKPVAQRLIAQGRAPRHGTDSRLQLLVKKFQPQSSDAAMDTADMRAFRMFDNITKGMTVAKIVAALEGQDGVTVFGEVLPARKASASRISFGHTLTLREAGENVKYQELVAECDGYLFDQSDKLFISSELEIRQDIGFKTGSVEFIGSAVVYGNVLKDFLLHTRGDVTVNGNAIHASVRSEEGSIKIFGSAYGTRAAASPAARGGVVRFLGKPSKLGKSQYCAAKNFRTDTLQGATVEAGVDIEVHNEASDCLMKAGSFIKMSKGHFFGGTAMLVKGGDFRIIGTKSGSATEILIVPPTEISPEYSSLKTSYAAQHALLESLKLKLGPYADKPELAVKLPKAEQLKIQEMSVKYQAVVQSVAQLQQQVQQLSIAHVEDGFVRINFREAIFRGTKITAGDQTWTPEGSYLAGPKTIEYHLSTRAFKVSELKALYLKGE